MRKRATEPSTGEIGKIMWGCHEISNILFHLAGPDSWMETNDPLTLLPRLVKGRILNEHLAEEIAELFAQVRYYIAGFDMVQGDVQIYGESLYYIAGELKKRRPKQALRVARRNPLIPADRPVTSHAMLAVIAPRRP